MEVDCAVLRVGAQAAFRLAVLCTKAAAGCVEETKAVCFDRTPHHSATLQVIKHNSMYHTVILSPSAMVNNKRMLDSSGMKMYPIWQLAQIYISFASNPTIGCAFLFQGLFGESQRGVVETVKRHLICPSFVPWSGVTASRWSFLPPRVLTCRRR